MRTTTLYQIGPFMSYVLNRVSLPLLLLLLTSVITAQAQQRVTFESLASANRTPGIHLDFVYQPSDNNQTEIIIVYRIRHTFLTFRRQLIETSGAPQTRFASDIDITFDFYDGETPPVPDRPFIRRETWRGSVTVSEYAETQDADRFVMGMTTLQLPAGQYRMIPTIQVNGRQVAGIQPASGNAPNQRRMSRREAREREQAERRRGLLEVPDFTSRTTFGIVLLEDHPSDEPARLMNLGRNVRYAQDYQLLVSGPTTLEADSISIALFDLGAIAGTRSADMVPIWTQSLSQAHIWAEGKLRFDQREHETRVEITSEANQKQRYWRVTVPNHRFPNSWYEADILSWKDGVSTQVGNLRYLAFWQDIPTSLLNLDLAIDMMQFLIDRDALREMRRGSSAERETRFRAFWKERDPTPDTDFNELMAEYYLRVDFVYRNFTTPSKSGIDSDQGRIYIVYGPPDATERTLPPGGTPTEVWTYGNRTFIFRATSGFGDFELVPTN
jgi:GWxTD domain-containing protein